MDPYDRVWGSGSGVQGLGLGEWILIRDPIQYSYSPILVPTRVVWGLGIRDFGYIVEGIRDPPPLHS